MTARPLAPLPVQVRPRHGETADSYIRRLARANHLNPSYLRSRLCLPGHKSIQADMLAAVSGRTVRALEHTLAGVRRRSGPGAPTILRPPRKALAEETPVIHAIRRDAAAAPSAPVRQLAARNQASTRTVLQALTPPGSGSENAWSPLPAPILAPLAPLIDAWLAREPGIPAYKIWERLLDEHDVEIGYQTVNAYVTHRRARLTVKTGPSAGHKHPIAASAAHDRLSIEKARPGQRGWAGPIYLARDTVLEESRPRRRVMGTRERGSKTVLRKKHILTIPREVVDHMRLEEGDEFLVTEESGRIVLTPALSIPADQAWFWSPEWQARIAEAEADRVNGNSTVYRSEEEFLASLGDD